MTGNHSSGWCSRQRASGPARSTEGSPRKMRAIVLYCRRVGVSPQHGRSDGRIDLGCYVTLMRFVPQNIYDDDGKLPLIRSQSFPTADRFLVWFGVRKRPHTGSKASHGVTNMHNLVQNTRKEDSRDPPSPKGTSEDG